MKKLTLAITLATLIGAATMTAAQATPAGMSARLGDAALGLTMVDKTQYVYGGRRYCWYVDGWQGPGWYWCGYNFRRGLGWGGGAGWHGWSGGRRGGGVYVGGRRGGDGGFHGQRSGMQRGGTVNVGPRGGTPRAVGAPPNAGGARSFTGGGGAQRNSGGPRPGGGQPGKNFTPQAR